MGLLTPFPHEVIAEFKRRMQESPEAATDWYYAFSQATDYIRSYRICKDRRWKTETEYGDLDITINLSKPEKDPKAIAAAKNTPKGNYPQCMLCRTTGLSPSALQGRTGFSSIRLMCTITNTALRLTGSMSR